MTEQELLHPAVGPNLRGKPYYHLLAQGASAPAPEMPVRYPVAIAIDANSNPDVIANDGTMWFLYECEWHQLPPLPQPEAETNDD